MNLQQYASVYIFGLSLCAFSFIFSALLIIKYSKTHKVEFLWVIWWLVIGLIMNNKFL